MIADTLRRFLDRYRIADPVLVAVSGGTDSTALLLAFVELGGVRFEAAHVNHHLRGAESDDDEAFVRELCARYDVPLHVVDAPLDEDAVRRSGVEAAAREVRYERLLQLGFRWVATAHQKNDQAETIVMRLMTGGGIAALRGIHPVREDGIIRPFLTLTRAQLSAFVEERGITARVDRSNSDPRFLRNRVRAALAQFDATAIDNLAAIADQAREQWQALEKLIDESDKSVATENETRFKDLPHDPWLRRAIILKHIKRLDPRARDISAADLERLTSATKRTTVTASLEMTGDVLRRIPTATPHFELQLRAGETKHIPQIDATVTIRTTQQPRNPATQTFALPPGGDPMFTVRNRKHGDRFQPLGMSREKKLKDFLIDRKIPAEVRDRIPLLVWNDAIVWVAGVEISEAFKVTGAGGELYEVAIETKDQESVQRESRREPRRKAREAHPQRRR